MRATISDFRKLQCYTSIEKGSYTISYNDTTHHGANFFEPLLKVEINRSPFYKRSEAEPFFSVSPLIRGAIIEKDKRIMLDTISLSLTRSGLLAPSISEDLYSEIDFLSNQDGIVLIADSNSLYNGSIHWLTETLRKPIIWLLPFVMSLTQIQQRDAGLKSMVGAPKPTNLGQALRSRAFINTSLGLLERNKGRYQVVELEPSLLRYLKTSGKNTTDPDHGDVLEDRLFVEGIHAVLRSTRTRATQRVVTSDVLLARILQAEGIPTLYIPVPKIGDATLSCIRYDPILGDFRGAPLANVLWDLTHSFSSIKFSNNSDDIFLLSAYWQEKIPKDWHVERLNVEVLSENLLDEFDKPVNDLNLYNSVYDHEGHILRPSENTSSEVPVEDSRENLNAAEAEIVSENIASSAIDKQRDLALREFLESKDKNSHKRLFRGDVPALSGAELPQASLNLVLKVANAIRSHDTAISLDNFLLNNDADKPSESAARRALEILRRINGINFDGNLISATTQLDQIDGLLSIGDLDSISKIFEKFLPYRLVLDALKTREKLDREK